MFPLIQRIITSWRRRRSRRLRRRVVTTIELIFIISHIHLHPEVSQVASCGRRPPAAAQRLQAFEAINFPNWRSLITSRLGRRRLTLLHQLANNREELHSHLTVPRNEVSGPYAAINSYSFFATTTTGIGSAGALPIPGDPQESPHRQDYRKVTARTGTLRLFGRVRLWTVLVLSRLKE